MNPPRELLVDDPLWLIAGKVLVVFASLMLVTLLMIWFERRVVGRMQHRPGPNRAGPFGLLQSLADGLKLAFKEDIRPVLADKWVYILAPVISTIPAFVAFSVVPLGGPVTIFGEETLLQVADLQVGVLVVLAASSIGVYGVVLAGWSSGSPYPLLGGLRSAAQMISYELALGFSAVTVVLYAGSLSTLDIVLAQGEQWWFVFLLFPSFAVFFVAMVGEVNRAPFDLPEAESELVGGFHTEYSSLKFALFFLSEYINIVMVSAIATTLFLGGWQAPWPLSQVGDGMLNTGWWTLLWFMGKTFVLLFVFVWLRGTLPRMRYDQFMALGWKVLLPVSLVWIVLVSGARALRGADVSPTQILVIGGLALAALVFVAVLLPDRRPPEEPAETPTAGSDYPLPPLDLTVPPVPSRRPRVGGGGSHPPATVTAGSGKEEDDGTA